MRRVITLTALVVLATAAGTAKAAAVLSCGTVITSPGVYELTADLNCATWVPSPDPNVDPSGAIVVMGAQGVTIDLNGHTLSGPGATTNTEGLLIQGGAATVKNGTIRGFGLGVNGSGGSAVQTDGLRVTKNGSGIGAYLPASITIRRSYVNENLRDGIFDTEGGGLYVYDSQVVGNGGNGLSGYTNFIWAERNVISRNGGNGVWNQSWGVYLKDNQVNNNRLSGIFLDLNGYRDSYWILSNTANGNGGHGIDFEARASWMIDYPPLYFEANIARDNLTSPQCVNIFCRTS
jgi:hypothetical protein